MTIESTGYMSIEVSLKNNGLVMLIGSKAKYWKGEGLPDYVGPIDGLPQEILDELIKMKAIKKTD